MALNPITALSEQLQKLINEHGSAAILRDHLALFKDQVMLLEKENATLKQKVIELEFKEQASDMKLKELSKDNEELRVKIQKFEQYGEKLPHTNQLDETKIHILSILYKQDKLPVQQLASLLNQDTETINYHISDLKTLTMVKKGVGYGKYNQVFDVWSIDQEGRRYLIENNLIT